MVQENALDLGEDRSLLLVDDDEPFLRRLAKAMEKRGFDVETAGSVAAGVAIATARPHTAPCERYSLDHCSPSLAAVLSMRH